MFRTQFQCFFNRISIQFKIIFLYRNPINFYVTQNDKMLNAFFLLGICEMYYRKNSLALQKKRIGIKMQRICDCR